MKLTKKEKCRIHAKYGEWAIITGASSGIGFELAKQIGSAGINLMIHSRQPETLILVEKELRSLYPIDIIRVNSDLSNLNGIEPIIQASQGLNIGMVVLSAGYGTSGIFIENSIHAELNLIDVNCKAVLALTHYFAQRFTQQNRGGIILLSSIVAFQGTPYAANYAATKAYIQSFAEALSIELKPLGVDVLAAAPGPVESGFSNRANMQMNRAMKPSQIGVPILCALGRKSTVVPGILSKILLFALRTVPRKTKVRIMGKIMAGMTQHYKNYK
jgi:short-subunit dehydrogenase